MWYVQHGSTFSSVEYTVQIDPSKVGVERIHFVRSHLKFDEPKPRSAIYICGFRWRAMVAVAGSSGTCVSHSSVDATSWSWRAGGGELRWPLS